MARDAELFVVAGQKKSGKTTTTLERWLLPSVKGDLARGVKPRKGLIFDTQHEEKYRFIKTLPVNKIGIFSAHNLVELRRIVPYNDDGRKMTPEQKVKVVQHILKHYFNGILVLEDINEYIFDYMPGDIVGDIISQRHNGVDVILHYHSLGRIHHKVWPHINELRMHKCEDNVIDNREKFLEKFEMFKIAENIVNDQFKKGNQHFDLTIRMQERRIMAQVSHEERQKAVQDYLSMFSKKLIQPWVSARDRGGKKSYTYTQAWDLEMERLNTTYFDA